MSPGRQRKPPSRDHHVYSGRHHIPVDVSTEGRAEVPSSESLDRDSVYFYHLGLVFDPVAGDPGE